MKLKPIWFFTAIAWLVVVAAGVFSYWYIELDGPRWTYYAAAISAILALILVKANIDFMTSSLRGKGGHV